jgi:hypothetical protein
MLDSKLGREHIRRRILDNLGWGNLPYHVIEPLPPLVVSPPPPSIPVTIPAIPPQRPRSSARQWAKKLITSIPLLGRVAIALMMPVLLPLSLAGALSTRLQHITRRIDELIR